MTVPSYLKTFQEGELATRIEGAVKRMEACDLCPRDCRVNRMKGETGFCETGRRAKVASYNAHFGEEAPLVGQHGSGTIFISSCNLLCDFCQNYEISHQKEGREVEPKQMAEMMVHLAERGCHNINFVTPSHVVPQILEALACAVEMGLKLPLVYNTGGYDKPETLKILDGIFDIYMPDFKFWEEKWSDRYCGAPDYKDVVIGAVKEMHRQVGDLVMDEHGVAFRGLLVRHLVMPGDVSGTEKIMEVLAKEISDNTYVNVMDQYRPCGQAHKDAFVNRRLRSEEFRRAMDAAIKAGLKRLDQRDRVRLIFKL
jgi:putative pyruvate formate lyase activating enzyme